MGTALSESTSATTPQAWATCLSVLSHPWKRWSLIWSVRVWSTPKTQRHSTAGWTMRKLNATKRWCCVTMTRPRLVLRSRPRATSPGCAPNPSKSSVSMCPSTAPTTDWFKKSVQTTATRIQEPTCQQVDWRPSQGRWCFNKSSLRAAHEIGVIDVFKMISFLQVLQFTKYCEVYVLVQYLACCRLLDYIDYIMKCI